MANDRISDAPVPGSRRRWDDDEDHDPHVPSVRKSGGTSSVMFVVSLVVVAVAFCICLPVAGFLYYLFMPQPAPQPGPRPMMRKMIAEPPPKVEIKPAPPDQP